MPTVKITRSTFEEIAETIKKNRPDRERIHGYPESIQLQALMYNPMLEKYNWAEVRINLESDSPAKPKDEDGDGEEDS